MLLRIIFLCAILLIPVSGFGQAIRVDDKKFSFTVPEAPWFVDFDAEGYTLSDERLKPDGKYGYFLLHNKENGVTFSLWIEPALKCKTSEECRDMVYRAGNPMWENLQNIVQSKIGDVYYFEFFRSSVQGRPVKMQDMYAEFVSEGYWIDLHISKPLYEAKDRALFENLVKSAVFAPKIKKPQVKADKAPDAAQKALEAWMPLWDAGKYKETYAELASLTKGSIDERTWFAYWTGTRKTFGKLKKRELVNSEYIKSMQGAPDREGAIFQYQSSFEKRESVLETFAMMREADGTWRVANYITN